MSRFVCVGNFVQYACNQLIAAVTAEFAEIPEELESVMQIADLQPEDLRKLCVQDKNGKTTLFVDTGELD